jgi:hypothetical protein
VSNEDKDSDIIEVVKRNGEFRKWGPFWGPILYWVSLKSAKPARFILWKWLVGVGTLAGGFLLK